MGAIEWTRHMFTGIADSTEREAWYTAAGLDAWFTITMGNTGADTMLFKPNENGYSLSLAFAGMNTTAANAGRYLNTITYNNPAGASAGTWQVGKGASAWTTATNGEICFDTAKVGDIDLLRICTSESVTQHHMLFVKDPCTTVDGAAAVMYAVCNPYWTSSAGSEKPLAGAYFMENTANSGVEFASDTANTIQYLANSYDYSEKYVLRPIISRGVISHLYSMDGGDAMIGGNVEFMLDKKTWFSVGHGILVKVK